MFMKEAHFLHGRRVAGVRPHAGDLSGPGLGCPRHHLLAERPAVLGLDRNNLPGLSAGWALGMPALSLAQNMVRVARFLRTSTRVLASSAFAATALSGMSRALAALGNWPCAQVGRCRHGKRGCGDDERAHHGIGLLAGFNAPSGASAGGSIGAELDAGTLPPVAISFYNIV